LNYDYNVEFGVYRNTAPWEEWTVTWNNFHDEPIFLVSSIFIENAYPDTWYSWEITSVVQDWVDGVYDNYGLTIKRMDQEYPFLYFVSSDHYQNLPDSWDPELYVEFTSNITICEGDSEPDGDVDGIDLVQEINSGGINIESFASEFGRNNCAIEAQITLSPTTITETANQGGPNPAPSSFTIENTGNAQLDFVTAVDTDDGAAWLAVTPNFGSVDSGASQEISVHFDVVVEALEPGTYNGTITVSGVTAGTGEPVPDQMVDVTLTVE
jgi:hypothetical protein